MSRLQTVATREVDDSSPRANTTEAPAIDHAQATKMLLLALQALSQRFVVALSNLFTLLTAASAFYLWMMALDTMTNTKIVGLTIYSMFILALNIHGRRK